MIVKSYNAFIKCHSFGDMFETITCGRCGGSGHYSYNQMDGTRCYGCNGTGKKFTRKSKKAIAAFKKLQEVDINTIKVGDRVNAHNGKFFMVENIEKTSWILNGNKVFGKTFTFLKGSYSLTLTGKIRKAHTDKENYKFYLQAMGAK